MGISIEPLEVIEKAASARVSEWDETVQQILAIPSAAAAFTVEKVGDELVKFKKAFRGAANKVGKSAVFGIDVPDSKGTATKVQVQLTEKKAGRPVGATNAPKESPAA